MANHKIGLDIVAYDRASSVFNTVRSNASSFSSRLMGTLGGAANGITSLDNALKSYNSSMYNINRVIGSVFRAAGGSIINFTQDAINGFSELERQHAKTMGALATGYSKTAEEQRKFFEDSERLKQQAITLGTYGPNNKGSLYTVNDVAYAQTALVKSGMTANDLLNTDAIESILKFAGGNDLDIDSATTFAVNLATVFDKPVEEWGRMLDMVTAAADMSVIDVPDIMESLTYTGGIASGLERDLEEVLGVIAVMGQAGLRGRVAGTGMQAFFTRILSAGELSDTQIENAPTDYVGQMYNAFISEAVNTDGTFKNMDKVAELLNTAMGSLNDQEQAWFAKKLFGLYQMKAAYALTDSVDGNTNTITDAINKIAKESEGANNEKYEIMLESQYGKLARLKYVWEGTKVDFGDRLSPATDAIADELFAFLEDPNNYEINWDNLRQAFAESGDQIAEKYGEQLGQIVEDIGNAGVNGAMITEALLPQFGGIASGFVKLMNGDISGAIDEFHEGLDETNENIKDLPPELQDLAKAARNVINFFLLMSKINIGTKILQAITSVLSLGITVAKMITHSTSTSVTSTTANMSIGTATTVNIGSVPLMNVTATVVNVYGAGGNPTNPTNPTTPQLPSPTVTPQLPSPTVTPQLPSPTVTPQLPGGTPVLIPWGVGKSGKTLLPSGTGGTGSEWWKPDYKWWNDPTKLGKATTGNKLGNALKGVGKFASRAMVVLSIMDMLTLGGDTPNYDSQYVNLLDKAINDKGLTDSNAIRQYLMDNAKIAPGDLPEAIRQDYFGKKFDDHMAMYEKWNTYEGADEVFNKIVGELNKNGKLSEGFLQGLVTYSNYKGNKADIEYLINEILLSDYDVDMGRINPFKTPLTHAGSFPDNAISDFLKKAIGATISNGKKVYDNAPIYIDYSDLPSTNDTPNNIAPNNNISGLYNNILKLGLGPISTDKFNDLMSSDNVAKNALSSMDSFMNRVNSPTINVNVTTNVDKSGNATSKVDINTFSKTVAQRSSRYGGTTDMIN